MNITKLYNENKNLKRDNKRLRNLCDEKDSYFKELMSDALRHRSKIAGKHMADRKKYLNNK